MIQYLKQLFGVRKEINYKQMVEEGALILDVRSKREYEAGHIKGSKNIPVDQLAVNLAKLPSKDKPVITCCASGMRSAAARTILRSKGYKEVYNGGAWAILERKIR